MIGFILGGLDLDCLALTDFFSDFFAGFLALLICFFCDFF